MLSATYLRICVYKPCHRPTSTRQLFTRSLRDLSVSINLVTAAPPHFNTQYVSLQFYGLRVAQHS